MKYSEEERKHLFYLYEFITSSKVAELERLIRIHIKKVVNLHSYLQKEENIKYLIDNNLFGLPFIKPNFLKRLFMKNYEYSERSFISCLNEFFMVITSHRYQEFRNDIYKYCQVVINFHVEPDRKIIFIDGRNIEYSDVGFSWDHFNAWIAEYDHNINIPNLT